MNPLNPQADLAKLLADWTAGALSLEEVGKTLLDIAFEMGLPSMFLLQYLTEKGAKNAELAADIAENAKLTVQAMKRGEPLP